MRKPNAASALLFLASAGLLGATRWHAAPVTVDRAFLGPLGAAVEDYDAGRGDEQASELFWPNFDELVYLARKGDRQALHVSQRLLLHESLPGSCPCCSGGFAAAIFANDRLPPGFLEEMAHLPAKDQARVLTQLDYVFKDTPDAGYESWQEERAGYLAFHQPVAALYRKPDFETEPAPEVPADSASLSDAHG